jgi:hypothetical protein
VGGAARVQCRHAARVAADSAGRVVLARRRPHPRGERVRRPACALRRVRARRGGRGGADGDGDGDRGDGGGDGGGGGGGGRGVRRQRRVGWAAAHADERVRAPRALLGARRDKAVRLWEIGTGRVKHTLTGHTDKVAAVCFSPMDSTRAVTVGNDRCIKVRRRRRRRHQPGPAASCGGRPRAAWSCRGGRVVAHVTTPIRPSSVEGEAAERLRSSGQRWHGSVAGKDGNLSFQANPVLLRLVCCGNRLG